MFKEISAIKTYKFKKKFSCVVSLLFLCKLWMVWVNHLEKEPIQKTKKTVKIKVKLPHVNKKPQARKFTICSHTVFSLYFKIRALKFHTTKPFAFPLHFLFRRDQNHYFNLTLKIMKMCDEILKKDTAP